MNENQEFISRGRGRGRWTPRDGENWRSTELRRPNPERVEKPLQAVDLWPEPRPQSNGVVEVQYRPLRRPYSAPEGNAGEEYRHTELRRPHTHQSPRVSGTDLGGAGDSSFKSTLSPNAPEFFPSSYHSNRPVQAGYSPPQDQQYGGGGDATMEAVALQHITGVMRHLTRNPDMFDKMIHPLVETFESWLSDDDTIDLVITAMVEQSIEQPNFQYSGSKLCAILDRRYPIVFRKSLLNKCREEFEKVMQLVHTNPRRVQGFLLFMAELYKQIDLVEGSGKRIVALGNIILDTMRQLIQIPSLENVKCVCQTLKLVGLHLDNQDQNAMNDIHQYLRELTANPVVSPNVQLLTSAACSLRESNWGRSGARPEAANPQQPPPPPASHVWTDGPVFFGPDGKVLTREESQFLQDSVDSYNDGEEGEDDLYGDSDIWEHDEEMDEEIQAAFQQFLTMGKRSTTNR